MNDLVKTDKNELTSQLGTVDDFLVGRKFRSANIEIPKILCMQSQSDMVVEGDGKIGEFRTSDTNEVIGFKDTPVDLIPFYYKDKWVVFKNGDFSHNEDMTAENENLPWKDMMGDGTEIKRERCIQTFCLRPSDIKKGTAIPYVMNLKGTSHKAGRIIAFQMDVRNPGMGKYPFSYHFNLYSTITKSEKNKGTYAVVSARLGEESTIDEMLECKKWYLLIAKGDVVVDEVPESAYKTDSDPKKERAQSKKKKEQHTSEDVDINDIQFDEDAF